MARRMKVPQHALTSTMKYIPRRDSAWDHERIIEEAEKMQNVEDGTAHPVHLYFSGASRFDLEGSGVLEYLDMTKEPEIWHIRRLKFEEAIRVDACTSDLERFGLAFAIGVTKVENCPPLSKLFEGETRPSERRIRATAWDYSVDCVAEVGGAVIAASQDLTEQEKKV